MTFNKHLNLLQFFCILLCAVILFSFDFCGLFVQFDEFIKNNVYFFLNNHNSVSDFTVNPVFLFTFFSVQFVSVDSKSANSLKLVLLTFILIMISCSNILINYFFKVYIPVFSSFFFLLLCFLIDFFFIYEKRIFNRFIYEFELCKYISHKNLNKILTEKKSDFFSDKQIKGTALFYKIHNLHKAVNGNENISFSVMNELFEEIQKILTENDGCITAFNDFATSCVYGAPVRDEEHSYHACKAALQIVEFQSKFIKENLINNKISNNLESHIGINSGEMFFGNIGTQSRKNYSVIGSSVDLAKRLESANNAYNTSILITEKTWNDIKFGIHNEEFVVRKLDKVRVAGFDEPIQLFELVGFKNRMQEYQLKDIELFEEALTLYLNKDFTEARKLFIKANELNPIDKTPLVYANRCLSYAKNGVDENWKGIFSLILE